MLGGYDELKIVMVVSGENSQDYDHKWIKMLWI
jgi:hypothetical protein